MTMTLDMGASVSVITQKSYKAKFPNLKLHKSEILLENHLEAEGEAKYNDQEVSLPLVVVERNGPPLLGRNWLQKIVLDWKEIKAISTGLDSLLNQYAIPSLQMN